MDCKGPIRTISVHAENGIITSMRFSCKGVEIADVVALWHRPDRIRVEAQHYLAYWDTEGLLAEGHLYGAFDYHAPVESLTSPLTQLEIPRSKDNPLALFPCWINRVTGLLIANGRFYCEVT